MSAESNQPTPTSPEAAEPKAGRTASPVWLFVLLFVLLYWGMVYFDQRSGWFNSQVYAPYHSYAQVEEYQPRTEGPDLLLGRKKFEDNCAVCHNSDGTGKPNQAPPFVGSEWVTGNPARMIQIPITGLTGPIQVAGKEMSFPIAMPNIGAGLPDADLAIILTYMRHTFGNKASHHSRRGKGGPGQAGEPQAALHAHGA